MEPNPDTSTTLHFLVGGLHSKVDLLLAREGKNAERIDTLERRYWVGAGLGLALLFYLYGGHALVEMLPKAFAGY